MSEMISPSQPHRFLNCKGKCLCCQRGPEPEGVPLSTALRGRGQPACLQCAQTCCLRGKREGRKEERGEWDQEREPSDTLVKAFGHLCPPWTLGDRAWLPDDGTAQGWLRGLEDTEA